MHVSYKGTPSVRKGGIPLRNSSSCDRGIDRNLTERLRVTTARSEAARNY